MPPFFYSLVSNQDESNSISSYKDKNELGKLFYESHQSISTITPKSNGGAALDISSLIGSSSSTKGVISQQYTGFETQYYIRLGSLLEFLQNKVLPKYEGKYPVLKFDTESNNYIYAIDNQVSMDPRICLINANFDTTGEDASYAREGDPYKTTISDVKLGQVMNIYVNFRYMLTTLDSHSDTKNTTSLIDFLQSLLTEISKAIGGINSLHPFIDEETNTVKIIDQTPLNDKNSILSHLIKNKSNSNTILNLYGYYYTKDKETNQIISGSASFVRNFGIKTELSPELASMLTIGAQAAGSVVGMDATGFSKLNQGLEDRVKKTVTDANHVSGSTQTDKLVELNDKYPKANANFTAAAQQLGSIDNGTIPIWDAENIDTYSSLQIDFIQYQEAKTAIKEDKSSASIGFIPINLNLTMDGLSGIKIYNSLKVDTTYLPSNYPDTMDFIIQGVSHKIEGNDWTTSLDTLMVPKNPSHGENNNTSKSTPKSENRTTHTSYPHLPFTDPRPGPDTLTYKDAAIYLNKTYGKDLGKAVFAIMFAEASKSNNSFRSAGGHNYSGVQTDVGVWGAPGIIGQYSRIDSGNVRRSFAIFDNDFTFLNFMANRVKSKGISGIDGNKWVVSYINKWWSPKARALYSEKTHLTYKSKLAIYNSAIKRYNTIIS